MTDDLLLELHRRGVQLRLDGERLDVLAPTGVLTDELREQLRSQRDHLVGMLRTTAVAERPATIVTEPADRHEPFPLTDIQHAYWVGRSPTVELGGVATHFYVELERDGADVRRLADSLRQVIDRHDMLRAVLRPDGTQHVLAEVPEYEIAVADLTGLPADEQDRRIAATRADMSSQLLDPYRWPLFDIRASVLPADRLRLHVSLDLLIADAYSMYLLFRDWRQFCEDPDWASEPLELSFRDCVLADRRRRDGSAYQRARDYWQARLADLPPAPALPLAIAPAQVDRPVFVRRRMSLPPAEWGALKDEARRRGLTPSCVLAAAFAEILRTWANQDRFTLNLSLFNRPAAHPQIAELIGDFTSLTLLEVDATPDVPFGERAQRLQRQLMRDLAHMSYSGVQVQRDRVRLNGGGLNRGLGGGMPVVFTSALAAGPTEDATDGRSLFGGTGYFGTFVYGISQTPQVWLDHQVAEEQGALFVNWDAVEALFPAGLLDDMFAAYCDVLDRLGHDPRAWEQQQPLARLPERQRAALAAANDTDAPYPAATLPELVATQIRTRPDDVAVIAGERRVTYRELADDAYRLAGRLGELGVGSGELVAVILPRGPEQAGAVLGITAAGAAYLPIDPAWPAARRRQLLDIGRVRVVVSTAGVGDCSGRTVVTFSDAEVRAAAPVPPESGPAPADLAYVIFTSGSTGEPKGVMIDHRAAANTIQDLNDRFGVRPGDAVLALSALTFDLSVYDLFGLLAAGATVVLPNEGGEHDPDHWTDLIVRHRITIWNSVPALMQAWLDRPWPGGRAPLRLVMLSGDWIPVTLPDAVRARCPDADVVGLGGATEASIWSVFHRIGKVPAEWVRIPYGRPLANQTMHVVDARLADCPDWTVGEICIGGDGLARGYWGDPDRSAERFVCRPGTGVRLYRTGDQGRRRPGGDIDILGRTDGQVKINGYRIELGEIASTLLRLPGVRDAAVAVDTNPTTRRRQLVAYVVPDQGGQLAWPPIVAAAAERREQHAAADAAGLAGYGRMLRAINEIAVPVIAGALAGIGEFTVTGRQRASADGIARRIGLRPRPARLLVEWLALLDREGLLVADSEPGVYRCPTPLSADELAERVDRALAELPGEGALGLFAGFFANCARHQVDLLLGRANVLEFLVPDGTFAVADALYGDNPMARLQNAVVAEVARAVVRARPTDRRLSVLEVGAGCGATSAAVLPELPPDRTEYRFTDVSTYFTRRARSRLAAYPFVSDALFDIDRPPAEQGVPDGSVDLVIAANVLHNAADLNQTLRGLHDALAPGGVLVAVENTVNEAFHLVTVGHYQDLGTYRDGRSLPLLDAARWQERFRVAGFTAAAAVPDGSVDALGQHVLVAGREVADEAQVAAGGVDPAGLRAALAELLPAYLVPGQFRLLDRIPLSGNGKVDLSAVSAAAPDEPVERVEPRTDLERQLLEAWREALAQTDVGTADNFFELGGDSLHALQIISRLRDNLGLNLTSDEGLQILFDGPTVAEMAVALRPWTG